MTTLGRHDCYDVQSCDKARKCSCGAFRGHLWNLYGIWVKGKNHSLYGCPYRPQGIAPSAPTP